MAGLSARTVAFLSNKGGVGKTHIAVNLAIQLAREGRRVLLIDTDLGSANADIRLGIRPSRSLMDFFERRADIFDCLTPTSYGIHFIAGRSGEFSLANLVHQQKLRLLRGFDKLVKHGGYTDIFYDLGAGIGSRVLDFALVADECVIVSTPQDIVAGYAALKACWVRYDALTEMHYFKGKTSGKGIGKPYLAGNPSTLRMNIIVNQADGLDEAKKVYLRILDVARTFFYSPDGQVMLPLRYLGGIPYVNGLLRQAEKSKVPALVLYPHHPFSVAIQEISNILLERQAVAPNRLTIPFTDRVKNLVQAWAK